MFPQATVLNIAPPGSSYEEQREWKVWIELALMEYNRRNGLLLAETRWPYQGHTTTLRLEELLVELLVEGIHRVDHRGLVKCTGFESQVLLLLCCGLLLAPIVRKLSLVDPLGLEYGALLTLRLDLLLQRVHLRGEL